jgi:DNA repair protein NreA
MFITRPKWKDVELQKKVTGTFSTIKELGKDNFFGSSPPSVFVGSKLTYPNVNVGILSPPVYDEDSWVLDNPKYWAESETTIKDVVGYRGSLINSRFLSKVKDARGENRFLDIAKDIALGYKPVDIEVYLKKKPNLNMDKDKVTMPMGPTAGLKKVKITENVKVLRSVDKVFYDSDLKANEGVNYLYKKKVDENFLTKLLSIGGMGVKKNRKLVPTRWSITAVDDTIGKDLIENVKEYGTIDKCRLLMGNFFGNYYYVMLFPDVWSYELFEGYLPGAVWNFSGKIEFSTDNEGYGGRKNYAVETAGGYYATRLPVLEYLKKIKRQASILVVRFETPEYTDSLGVWVVRSAARKAMQNQFVEFETRQTMLEYVKKLIISKFCFNIERIYSKSLLLNKLKTQRKLWEFV